MACIHVIISARWHYYCEIQDILVRAGTNKCDGAHAWALSACRHALLWHAFIWSCYINVIFSVPWHFLLLDLWDLGARGHMCDGAQCMKHYCGMHLCDLKCTLAQFCYCDIHKISLHAGTNVMGFMGPQCMKALLWYAFMWSEVHFGTDVMGVIHRVSVCVCTIIMKLVGSNGI